MQSTSERGVPTPTAAPDDLAEVESGDAAAAAGLVRGGGARRGLGRGPESVGFARGGERVALGAAAGRTWRAALEQLDEPVVVVRCADVPGGIALARGAAVELAPGGGADSAARAGDPVLAYAGPTHPRDLGDPTFLRDHGLRLPYVGGAMANGIASEAYVEALAGAGMLGYFGAAGLAPARVETALVHLRERLGGDGWGTNLIHTPQEPALEAAIVELYLQHGVRRVSASAYLELTLPVVRYRVAGLRRGPDGGVVAHHRIAAKVSRATVARAFASPPPPAMVAALLDRGLIEREQAELAARVAMCDDLTAEAASGGHTDHRPAVALFPELVQCRDLAADAAGLVRAPRVGLAGGIGTPWAVAAAFAMGAAYVLVGSVHQACREAGTSDAVRELLAAAGPTDVARAPAADMFELGVTLQVLQRGTMFPARAQRLAALYRDHEGVDALPAAARQWLESQVFRQPLAQAWADVEAYWRARDPSQIDRAAADPKHHLALLCRAYLGLSSRWANAGEPSRALDYQVWCGPAMGAFNAWVAGSWLAPPAARRVVPVAHSLLWGGAVALRASELARQLAAFGLRPPPLGPLSPPPPVTLQELFP